MFFVNKEKRKRTPGIYAEEIENREKIIIIVYINLMRFHNAVALGKKITVCRLEVSQYGEFWEKIEEFPGLLKKRV